LKKEITKSKEFNKRIILYGKAINKLFKLRK